LVTIALIAITCLISYLAWQNPEYFQKGVHWPYREYKYGERWRSLSGGFLHSNGTHLMINMYMLYMFGAPIESIFTSQKGMMGTVLFLIMYLSAVIISSTLTGLQKRNNPNFRSVGASGATLKIGMITLITWPIIMELFGESYLLLYFSQVL